jgi:hypothetical protein
MKTRYINYKKYVIWNNIIICGSFSFLFGQFYHSITSFVIKTDSFSVCFKNKPKSIIKYKINCISDRILTTASVLTLMLRLRKFQIKKRVVYFTHGRKS